MLLPVFAEILCLHNGHTACIIIFYVYPRARHVALQTLFRLVLIALHCHSLESVHSTNPDLPTSETTSQRGYSALGTLLVAVCVQVFEHNLSTAALWTENHTLYTLILFVCITDFFPKLCA